MKILLCTTTFRDLRTGPTKFANMLYKNEISMEGCEFHILTEDISEESERLYKCNIGWPKKILPFAPVYRMYQYYKRAKELNKQHQFDYMLYNNAVYGLIHSSYSSNIVGFINDYNNQQNISGTKSGFNYNNIKKKIFKQFERRAIASLKLILTNSDYLTKLLQEAYPNFSSKIVRLYKGIDLTETGLKNDAGWNFENLKQIRILFVKNDFVTGGINILAEALSLMKESFLVTIVGPALDNTSHIQSFFKSNNITLNFQGPQSQQSVFELMASHHIFCVPSLQEALGVANLEALKIGIPVVSSDAGGIPEVLDYGNCGFISHAGNAKSLKGCIESCMYNKELRNEKVVYGLKHVRKFKKELTIRNLESILNRS